MLPFVPSTRVSNECLFFLFAYICAKKGVMRGIISQSFTIVTTPYFFFLLYILCQKVQLCEKKNATLYLHYILCKIVLILNVMAHSFNYINYAKQYYFTIHILSNTFKYKLYVTQCLLCIFFYCLFSCAGWLMTLLVHTYRQSVGV